MEVMKRRYPWILAVGASIGLLAAFVLTVEKFAVLQNPSHQLSCSINPVLSCGSIMLSDQAEAFGFPNPFLGIAAFSVVLTIGMALVAGAKFRPWFWRGLQIGASLGMAFVVWLIWQSLYSIGALCVYCMAVWIVTWPIFWYTTLFNLQEKNLPTPKPLRGIVGFAGRHHLDILIAGYVLVLVLIIENFWYYWQTLI